MSLEEAIRALAGHRVLVALDFDGTLSEIAEHPDQVRPVAGAVEALTELAGFDGVEVSVVSGRRLHDLRRYLGPPPGVTIVGEHGAAWDGVEMATPAGFDDVRAGLEAITEGVPGAWVEVKSTSLVVHTRQVDPEAEPGLVETITAFLAPMGLVPEHGKKVVDVTFVDTSKGTATQRLRDERAVDRVVFAGDDTTDESVFERLLPGDVGIRVGEGPSAAEFRVSGPADVVAVLALLAEVLGDRRPPPPG